MTTLQQPQHRPTRFLQQQTWMILLAIAVVLMLMPSLACAQNTTCSSQTLSDPEWPDTLEQTACITPGVSGTVETDNDSYDGNLDDLTVYGVAAEGVVTDSLGDVLFDSGMQDGDISATGGSSEVVEVPFEGEAYTLTGLANDCTWSPDAFSEDNFNYYNFQILCWDNSFPGASVSIPPVPLYSYTITPSGGSSGYAANGNLLSYTDSVNGTWSFGYDQLNRVTTANNSLMPSGEIWAQNFCWAYDSFGNRLQQTTSNVAFSAGTSSCTPSGTVYQNTWATFNAQNRMTSTNAPGWTITPPAYDGAGDVTNDGTNGYLYDAEGRICATHTGEGYFGYIYDAAGNRVAKGTISSTNWSCDVSTNGFALTEWYILGPSGEQLTETDGSGNWKHTNVYAAGQLIATYEASTNDTVFALTDWLGTKRVESGANGCATAYTGLPPSAMG
jgi:YD repeat-containing protein